LFHDYKTLLEIGKKEEKEEEVSEGSITNEIRLLTADKPHGKILLDRTYKKWQGLIGALHWEDCRPLLKIDTRNMRL
jgi:hypothetical protein